MKRLLTLVGNENKKKLLFVFLFSFFVTLLDLVSLGLIPVYFSTIIDPDQAKKIFVNYINIIEIINFSYKQIIIYSSICLLIVFILKNILVSIYIFFSTGVLRDIRIGVTRKIYKHYLTKPLNFHIENNPSYLLRNITIEAQTACKQIELYLIVIKEFIMISLLSVGIAFLNVKLFILNILVFVLLSLFIFAFLKPEATRRGKLVLDHKGKKLKTLNSTFQAIKDIKIYLAEYLAYKEFSKHYEQEERHRRWSSIISLFPKLYFEVVAVILVCTISIIFAIYEDAVFNFLFFISFFSLAVLRTIPSISSILSSMTSIKYGETSTNLIVKEILAFNNSKIENEIKVFQKREGLVFKIEKIIFKNVCFAYKKKPIFNNLNLTFEKNNIYGIIGRSGVGKSTLLDLITSLIKPTSGKILINEKYDIEQVKVDLRTMTGYVPQKVHLFEDTLKNNIILGSENLEINLDKITKYIQEVDLFEVENIFSNILEMNITNDGSNLSGGQIQRIGLIRALYKNPEILILDEFTNSLDNKNEQKILKFINNLKLNKIIIIISHSTEPLKICNKIIDLNNF